MIRFLLNDKIVSTSLPPGTTVLDLVRYHEHLMGTKIGCREGDCGACTVMVGQRQEGKTDYRSMTSCLLPVANVHGCHVVTIEGLNLSEEEANNPALNLVQDCMAAEGATQCGFCTPGFVVSLAGFCMNENPKPEKIHSSIDGNICRCTGYKSIERAAQKVASVLQERGEEGAIPFAVRKKIIPAWFDEMEKKWAELGETGTGDGVPANAETPIIAGGTDLYVQKPEEMIEEGRHFVFANQDLKSIRKEGTELWIGAAATVTDLLESELFNEAIPHFPRYARLISSTPIRNMGTLAGNFVNASPIGDLSIIFLALDARLVLVNDAGKKRTVPLRSFFQSYKKIDLGKQERVVQIICSIPAPGDLFHFEKVSKRTHLDIASVNTAIYLQMKDGVINNAGLSAGGVAPIPLFLEKTSQWLQGRKPGADIFDELAEQAGAEISPISDARGSKEYKSLLLGQLLRAHFNELFTEKIFTP